MKWVDMRRCNVDQTTIALMTMSMKREERMKLSLLTFAQSRQDGQLQAHRPLDLGVSLSSRSIILGVVQAALVIRSLSVSPPHIFARHLAQRRPWQLLVYSTVLYLLVTQMTDASRLVGQQLPYLT